MSASRPVAAKAGALCPLPGSWVRPADDRKGREAAGSIIPRHMAALPPKPDLGGPDLEAQNGSNSAVQSWGLDVRPQRLGFDRPQYPNVERRIQNERTPLLHTDAG